LLTYDLLQCSVATREVIKHIIRKPDESGDNGIGHDRFIVISLGTGSIKSEHKYNAKTAAKWGALNWLFNNGSTPILDCFSESSNYMVDYQNTVLFTALHSQDNYLIIQVS